MSAYTTWARWAFWLFAAILFTATHWPHLKIEGPLPRTDLWLHVGAFSTWAFFLGMSAFFSPPGTGRNFLLTLAIGTAYACLDEGLQLIPALGRTAGWDDLTGDIGGILLGALASWWLGARLA